MTTDAKNYLPYGRQSVDEDDIASVVEVLRGEYLTTGPTTQRFEEALAAQVNAPFAVAVNSGTAALHLACLAGGMNSKSAAIVPAITFVATANAVRYVGGHVAFCDVDPRTGLMRPQDVEGAIQRAKKAGLTVKAILPVHLCGRVVDLKDISAIAHGHGAMVIEDACHALGGQDSGGREIGSCPESLAACFSFHPVKTITMGEGGAITTRDAKLAERLRALRSHGITRDPHQFTNAELSLDALGKANPWSYEMLELGYNFRASDLNCVLGFQQLKKLSGFVSKRARLVAAYDELLKPLAPRLEAPTARPKQRTGWHLYPVLIDFEAAGVSRAELMAKLHEQGIGTQVHYIPVHRQPYYQTLGPQPTLPGAEAYYRRCLSLPLFPAMEHEDVQRVADALFSLLGG